MRGWGREVGGDPRSPHVEGRAWASLACCAPQEPGEDVRREPGPSRTDDQKKKKKKPNQKPRPGVLPRVWKENKKGDECLAVRWGIRFRPDGIFPGPASRPEINAGPGGPMGPVGRTCHKPEAQVKGSGGLDGTLTRVLPGFCPAHPVAIFCHFPNQASPHSHPHPKLSLGDRLPWGPLDERAGEE